LYWKKTSPIPLVAFVVVLLVVIPEGDLLLLLPLFARAAAS
jgi:hypothetical protein